MRIKSVDRLNGGEVLAESVLTSEKAILIPKGTAIREDYVSLIQALGIDALMIEDPYEELEKPNRIIHPARYEAYTNRVQRLMERHIYHSNRALREFEVIANEIVKDIDAVPENVIFDLQERTADLYGHTVMVTLLSVAVAKRLGFDRKKRYQIALGSLLHDIGIRYITVRCKNRDWEDADPDEVFEYKKHTILGYSAVAEESWIPVIARKMILSHHERLDGSGFPMHQKNRETECRIIQVCDAFDCCISGMECKRMPVHDSLQKIVSEAGIRFDSKIVDELLAMVARYPVGTTVKMTDGKEGVVITQTQDSENPIVLTFGSGRDRYNLHMETNISILHIV